MARSGHWAEQRSREFRGTTPNPPQIGSVSAIRSEYSRLISRPNSQPIRALSSGQRVEISVHTSYPPKSLLAFARLPRAETFRTSETGGGPASGMRAGVTNLRHPRGRERVTCRKPARRRPRQVGQEDVAASRCSCGTRVRCSTLVAAKKRRAWRSREAQAGLRKKVAAPKGRNTKHGRLTRPRHAVSAFFVRILPRALFEMVSGAG